MHDQSTKQKVWHLFYSYANEDEGLALLLDRHLSSLRTDGKITTEPRWTIGAGARYQEIIDEDFDRADIVLLLISPDYISSPTAQIEMKIALQRSHAGNVHAIPVLLRSVDWQGDAPGALNPLPHNRIAVTSWQNQDEALSDIAKGIRQLIEGNSETTSSSRTSGNNDTDEPVPPSSSGQRLGQTIQRYDAHSNYIYTVSWSPDGRRIASGGDDGAVHVWEAFTGHHQLTYRGHTRLVLPGSVFVVAWSPDAKYIASGGTSEKVHVWNPNNGQKVAIYSKHLPVLPGIYFLAWSPEGRRIASTNLSLSDPAVHIWDAISGRQLVHIDLHSVLTAASPGPVAWSPDAQQIAAGWDKFVYCYHVPTRKRLLSYDQHKNYVTGLSWLRDQQHIVSCDKGEIHVWKRDTLETVVRYVAHSAPIRKFALSPDNRYVASCGEDRTVHVWETMTGRQHLVYDAHRNIVPSVSWSPDGKYIASASNDGSVRIWRVIA